MSVADSESHSGRTLAPAPDRMYSGAAVGAVSAAPPAAPAPAIAPALVRRDADLRDLDVEAAITRGLVLPGGPRQALFTEGAIAASWQAQELGIGPYPLVFLARCVRALGMAGALDLPEPLIGAQPTRLAQDWMAAAAAVTGSSLAREDLFAQWLEMVAALLATRRGVADPSWK